MIISVGYHKNLASWFSTKQFSALDNGRKWAQREWAKVCNITWTAAKYPRVTIKPVYDKTAWARAPLYGSYIAISIDEKYRFAWENQEHWQSLFIHEYGHILGMKDTRTANNVLTIYNTRAKTPSPSEIAWVVKRYGKPKV